MTDGAGGAGGLEVLYADARVAVVAKAAGIPVHRGWAQGEITLVDLVAAALGPGLHPAHRLDQATSGAVIFARDAPALAALGAAFRERRVDKVYLALVRGHPPDRGTIDHPVAAKERRGGPRADAVTDFATLWRWQGAPEAGSRYPRRYALLEVRPRTGRLHQIRKHCKHLSHPLLGDTHYGKGDHNRWARAELGLQRLALHALRLGFPHPETGAALSVTAPLPEDLAGPLRRLGAPEALLRGLGALRP